MIYVVELAMWNNWRTYQHLRERHVALDMNIKVQHRNFYPKDKDFALIPHDHEQKSTHLTQYTFHC
jgi:ABC-type nickel/cobalt efflux system permease component RcnA